ARSPVPPAFDGDGDAVIVFTSGTTSRPRAVVHTRASLESGMRAVHDLVRPAPGRTVLGGTFFVALPSLAAGAPVAFPARRPARLARQIRSLDPQATYLTPPQIRAALSGGVRFRGRVYSGSAPVSASLLSAVRAAGAATTELTDLAARAAVHPVTVDLSTPEGPARLVDTAVAEHGGIDILINNVGAVRPRIGGFLSVTDDDWATAMTINFLTAVRATRAALPHLIDRGTSAIVTVNSVNARLPDPLVIDYSAAKAALANFSKSLSKEFAPHGVRVTTVSPGPVATGLWLGPGGVAATVAQAAGANPEGVAQQAAGQSATGRFTESDEVADLVLFLASDRAANITGADFAIDGGLITTL
ncbi:SDR family oxidoreductase, partial [Actinoplanes sp. NPDC051633]|uniref:SDR family oxidoreductase n=1 Tax=Actinoplanes sp. NPDC051633 TaxID=3155670 RepID=UPI00341DF618